MKKLFAMFMALAICLSMIPAAFAAGPDDAVIDADRLCSIDLYKYDLTAAEADGVWDNSYVSTGTYDKPGVNDILGNPNRVVDLLGAAELAGQRRNDKNHAEQPQAEQA